MCSRAALTFTLSLALAAAACATGGGAPGDDDGSDDDGTTIDASVPVADAPEGTPDAPTGTPDATMAGTPDAAPSCSPCQLVSQCGCNTDPMKPACDLLDGTGATTCRAVTAPGMSTSTCNGETGCAPGYICLGPAGESSCKRYCAGDSQCAGGGGLCVIEVTSGGNPIPNSEHSSGNLHVCSPSCNPFNGTGCPSGWACGAYYSTDQMRNFSWCYLPGAGVNNATCTDDGDCANGFTCVNVGGNTVCKKYCAVSGGGGQGTCPGGQTCINLTGGGQNVIIPPVTYGVCN